MVGVGNVLGFGLGDVDNGKGDIVGESVGFSYPMGVYRSTTVSDSML